MFTTRLLRQRVVATLRPSASESDWHTFLDGVQNGATHITISKHQLTTSHCKDLSQALTKSAVALTLTSTAVTQEAAVELASGLERTPDLTSLDMYNNDLQDEGAKTLLDGVLRYTRGIKTLDVARNGLRSPAFLKLAEAVSLLRSLQLLIISHNYMDGDSAYQMGYAISGTPVQAFQANHMMLGDNVGDELGHGLLSSANHGIVRLGLTTNALGAKFAKHLTTVVTQPSMESLDMTDNPVGPALAPLWREWVPSPLRTGFFINTQLDSESAHGLAMWLAHSTTLEGLDLSKNDIGPLGAQAIGVAAFTTEAPLRSLDLTHNPLGAVGKAAMELLSESRPGLRLLYDK